MTLFVDASALVAILSREPEAAALARKLTVQKRTLTSALAIWEASVAVARSERTDLTQAAQDIAELLEENRTEVVPIGPDEARLALEAHARYGKGRHPARLNMGDCFAYACARANGARLLYKGEDFALTDIEPA